MPLFWIVHEMEGERRIFIQEAGRVCAIQGLPLGGRNIRTRSASPIESSRAGCGFHANVARPLPMPPG